MGWIRVASWLAAGVTVFLLAGWLARVAEKGWLVDGRDFTTVGVYLAVIMGAIAFEVDALTRGESPSEEKK